MNRGASEHRAVPAFRTLFPLAAVVLLLALVTLAGRGAPARASHGSTPGVVDFVSIDMDTTGNTATVLGSRQACVSRSVGASFTIDITVDEVDPTDGVSAFEFTLNYDSSRLKVTAVDNLQLLASGGGTIPMDVSDPVPDTDGAFYVGFVDFSANYENGDGVLSRITLESTGAGVSPLTLTGPIADPVVYDQFTFPLTVNTVQNASEAQGVACPSGALLTVNSTADDNDFLCEASPGDCTLREAINAAVAHLGADTITFNAGTFPPNAPATISIGAALPTLTVSGDTIDGVGAGVIVDGVTKAFNCFTISGEGSDANTIKGLQIKRCATGVLIDSGADGNTIGGAAAADRNVISDNGGEGIDIFDDGTTGNFVLGNYIGTDAAGTGDLGNGASGIYVRRAQSNIIGGAAAGAGNVISGNDGFAGVAICGNPTFCGGEGSPGPGDASGNIVRGNYIGTNATASASVPNANRGVSVDGAPGAVIGGAKAGAGNVIAGNGTHGALLFNGSTGALIQGNYIGTNAAGSSTIGNGANGVAVSTGAQDNIIGGTAAGAANVIAHNGHNGVCVATDTSVGNVIRGNSIHSNGLLGIDLVPSGQDCATGTVTPNDLGDGDSGPNNLQNFPVITSATLSSGSTSVSGTLDTILPKASVDVYS
ncbi:MAG TPA: cohesin domain-containing protein, partial [Dehalococcoidia bacterium]|nr:cohesin domain-containing protein [Dehalococcoidia bacterium]